MEKIISAIPNLCEGNDKDMIARVSDKLSSIEGLVLLDVSMDSTRNRTVFAISGSIEAIFQGGFLLYETAIKEIDMREHSGEYPRIGALDVFPFVPIKDISIEESIEISIKFAEEVQKKFNIPIYLFAESSRKPLRKDIDQIRECEYEGLKERLKDPRWKPDLGPDSFNPDFGATIIGARHPLVSFKVHLDTKNIDIAKSLCREIQYSTGGLRHVSSHSGLVKGSGFAEITVSISNHSVTSPYKVVELIKVMAKRFSVSVSYVEMIGLIPEKVFFDAALHYMQVKDFKLQRILEKSVKDHF